MILANLPPTKINAANASSVVIAAAVTGSAMRWAASTAASLGLKPASLLISTSALSRWPTRIADRMKAPMDSAIRGANRGFMTPARNAITPNSCWLFSVPGIKPSRPTITTSASETTNSPPPRATSGRALSGFFSVRCPDASSSACSPTTIASSTIMPSVISRPKVEIILMLWPVRYMTAKVAAKLTGMPTATQNAVRRFRNRLSITITMTSPRMPLSSNSFSRALMMSARTL